MEPLVLSVPHTGTHFVMNLLRQIGKHPIQCHAEKTSINELERLAAEGVKACIPVRHPYKVFISHWQRGGSGRYNDVFYSGPSADEILAKVIECYQVLFDMQRRFDHCHFVLDFPTDQRIPQLTRLADFVGLEALPEPWFAVSQEWPVIGWMPPRFENPDIDLSPLDFVLQRYGYQPMDIKNYISVPGTKQDMVELLTTGGNMAWAPPIQFHGTAVVLGPDGKPKGEIAIQEAGNSPD